VQFIGDYHMHSTYSDGKATVAEMVEAAYHCKLSEVGISDHGPRNIGTGVKNSRVFLRVKDELERLAPRFPGLKMFASAEADIISPTGELDVSQEVIKNLDYLIVGLHPYVFPKGLAGVEFILGNQVKKFVPLLREKIINLNTKALVEAIYQYDVWTISHPGLKMEIDIGEVARACINRDTAWEINAGHKHPSYKDVLAAARSGVDFVVNSDAHFPESVGCLDYGSWVLEKCEVPVERVRNARKQN
jgi:putative hydrolase